MLTAVLTCPVEGTDLCSALWTAQLQRRTQATCENSRPTHYRHPDTW